MGPESTEQTPALPRHTSRLPLILSILCVILFASTAFLAYQNWQLREQLNTPTTYETCIASPGSIIQESYPATCVTKHGARFTQPLTEEEQQKLVPPTEQTTLLTPYSNGLFSFSYPSTWTTQGVTISSNSPAVRIVVHEEGTMMTECMDDTVEQQSGFVLRHFTRVTGIEACSGGDSSEKEIWVVQNATSYGPGIIIQYSSREETAVLPIIQKLLSTFKFTDTKTTPAMTACTMEAKICPDGSSVGRSGPKCEFAPCPGL